MSAAPVWAARGRAIARVRSSLVMDVLSPNYSVRRRKSLLRFLEFYFSRDGAHVDRALHVPLDAVLRDQHEIEFHGAVGLGRAHLEDQVLAVQPGIADRLPVALFHAS